MKKAKKYIYPFAFLIGFFVFYTILGIILETVFDNGSYAGTVFGAFAILITFVIIVPIYCIKYGNIIKNQKLKFLFSAYNTTVFSASYILPFRLEDETYIYAIFLFAWVMFWSMLPLIVRLDSRKNTENTPKNKAEN